MILVNVITIAKQHPWFGNTSFYGTEEVLSIEQFRIPFITCVVSIGLVII